jgi:hypothetical protein
MSIKPDCVVCGFDAAGSVQFANYPENWTPPDYGRAAPPGSDRLNELGVAGAPGVGLFCERHLEPAEGLRHLEAQEAVRRLRRAGDTPR